MDNPDETFEETLDQLDPDADQLGDNQSHGPEDDGTGDDTTFGARNPETPRQGEADGSYFLSTVNAIDLTEVNLQNVTARDRVARQAATLLQSVIKMDRIEAAKNKGLDATFANDDIENDVLAQVDNIRTGKKVRITSKRPDRFQYVSNAVRQSIGAPSISKWVDVPVPSPRATKETRPTLSIQDHGDIMFAGHRLTIKSKPLDVNTIADVRQYDKTKRHVMTAEGLQKFADRATGYVLGKRDKLTVPVINLTDDSAEKVMEEVLNLSSKLTTLKTHMTRFDIGDVMEVLVPIDLTKSCELEE